MTLIDVSHLKRNINEHYLADETDCMTALLDSIEIDPLDLQQIEFSARDLVEAVRKNKSSQGTIEAFIQEYSLSSYEGIMLMCLAEALLRIPDDITADRLIKSKMSLAEFKSHMGNSHSLFVNASTWGLMLTGKLVKNIADDHWSDHFIGLVGRLGEPVIRTVLTRAMKVMASQYVMGVDIDSALRRAKKEFSTGHRFSFDMLGESALSTDDASRYFKAYHHAIERISITALDSANQNDKDNGDAPSISIKLSALHPRYEVSQRERVLKELVPDLLRLVQFARQNKIAVTLDAEEADKLELSLEVFECVVTDKTLDGWNGLGLAVQAYQKRAMPVLKWLNALASKTGKTISVRLVKGAYWDTEIKRAQEQGLSGYPVFTRKSNTDVSYIVCAKYLLKNINNFYPQFATHNAHTIATIQKLANNMLANEKNLFEFQRLHGMGGSLYDKLPEQMPCRIYSPVGSHKNLLPYLVRRLLENGANSSFVNRIENENISIDRIIKNPIDIAQETNVLVNPQIPLPESIFSARKNSLGPNLSDLIVLDGIKEEVKKYKDHHWFHELKQSGGKAIANPADCDHIIGYVNNEKETQLLACLDEVASSSNIWQHSLITDRIKIIRGFSELLKNECLKSELISLCVYEAGKTINDAVSEIREAIDFCEYYISQAVEVLSAPVKLEGPVGEDNVFSYHGRGMFVCISPWNFPVAIFIGQIVAALVTGNSVIAKPSSNTVIISKRIVDTFYKAGLPQNVLSLVNCSGKLVNDVILNDERVSGVAFTGSFETATQINLTLAKRRSPIVPLIAETGGLNAMIVDSSALPEQVVIDVISSAFLSAGQRCSALRILIVQRETLDRIQTLLIRAMDELSIGNPSEYSNDIPPVINKMAMDDLNEYKRHFKNEKKLIHEVVIPDVALCQGNYVSPTLLKIDSLSELDEEKFGPILHILPYDAIALDELINEINDLGYGLTLGIHSRVDDTIAHIANRVNVGNIYVNRNMVGAVVGVQPFGGEGYSGTGPKAGGPNYLQRFCTEKTVTINTSAIGGNADLLSMSDS